MKHQPWSQEQAEKWATVHQVSVMDDLGSHNSLTHVGLAFLAGMAKAAEMIEACPTMYGSHIGDPINRYWESIRGSCDTHEAKLVGVRPIESDGSGSGAPKCAK